MQQRYPEILSPAGDMQSALAGIIGGANAIFLGLKHFSARMKAENFSITDVAKLTEVAHKHSCKTYIALNTLVKPSDVLSISNLIMRLTKVVHPDALIIQDIGLMAIAREAGFTGEFHLSTLANVTYTHALQTAKAIGAHRVVLPREIHLDEIQELNRTCPEDLTLELFIHGALCYMVSGRCYWSSYLGGKSGLRGRCVQPCRRIYSQGKKSGRFFSSQDLSLEELITEILPLQAIRSWKIEGRKKGAHYVYHTTKAYVLLRDNPKDIVALKEAHKLLEYAISRTTTSAPIHSGKKVTPVDMEQHTNTGIAVGKIVSHEKGYALLLEKDLFIGDTVRIGYEDEAWYMSLAIKKQYPTGTKLPVQLALKALPKKAIVAFLIDRKASLPEKEVKALQKELNAVKTKESSIVQFAPSFPKAKRYSFTGIMTLESSIPQGKANKAQGLSLWVSPRSVKEVSRTIAPRITWWLPPVVWQEDERQLLSLINILIRNGARTFVCNDILQYALLPETSTKIVGPFCNVANLATITFAKEKGYHRVIVSPELSKEDLHILVQQSPLPLGMVTKGYFPIGITRFEPTGVSTKDAFVSPQRESFWMKKYGGSYWYFPAWEIDLSGKEAELTSMGYSFFIHTVEYPPKGVAIVRKNSTFNWDLQLL